MKLKDIEKLCDDGYITSEQKTEIAARYNLNEPESRRWLTTNLGILAALLIGSGVIMLSVQNWMYISVSVKMTSCIALLALAWLGYFICRDKMPKVAQGLAMLGAGMWLGCLIMLNLLFALDWTIIDIAFLFFVGILPIPLLSNQKLLAATAVCSSLFLLLIMCENCHREEGLFPWLQITVHNDTDAFCLVTLLVIVWWLLLEKTRGNQGLYQGYTWISIPLVLLFIFFMQFIAIHLGSADQTSMIGNIAMAAAPVMCLLLKPKKINWLSWILVTLSICSILPCAVFTPWTLGKTLVGLGTCSFFSLVFFIIGARQRRTDWVNYGAIMAFMVMIALCANVLKSLEESGIVLICIGVVAFILGITLERQRRKLIHKIKDNQ